MSKIKNAKSLDCYPTYTPDTIFVSMTNLKNLKEIMGFGEGFLKKGCIFNNEFILFYKTKAEVYSKMKINDKFGRVQFEYDWTNLK